MQADSATFQESSTPESLVSAKLNYSGLQQPPFKERMPHVRRTAPRTEVFKQRQRTCEAVVGQAELVHALGKRAPLLRNGPL